jgi:nitronate monooxygenase
MKTRFTETFGVEYPIMCGGMLWLATPELAAAISNAGAMGNLTSGNYDSGDALRAAIDRTRALTERPFAVNITTMPSIRLPIELLQEFFRVCCERKVALVEIAGAPVDTFLGKEFLPMAKEAGVKVLHKVGTVKHAVHAQKVGYDAVTIAGFEEGGFPHKDDVGTMVLVPKVCEAVDIPVLAAGGMVDGKSLAAVLALGADGMMMATRFLATTDCAVHPNIHALILARGEHDTSLGLKKLLGNFGLQVRALNNGIMRRIREVEETGGDFSSLFPLISGQRAKEVWATGDAEEAMLTVGQSIGRITDIPTVKDLVARIAKEADAALSGAMGKVRG